MPELESSNPTIPSEASLTSASGRTRVAISVKPDGSWSVSASRDGRTVYDFSMNDEQAGPDGTPKSLRR